MKMKPYTKIPNLLFEESQLSINERYLLGLLLKYCGKSDWCWPSQKTLAKMMGCSERQIRKLIKKLIDKELIFSKRTGFNKTNTYKVTRDLIRIDGSFHIGTPVPLHTGTIVPTKSTYIKEKDKKNEISYKEFERRKKELIKKKTILPTKLKK